MFFCLFVFYFQSSHEFAKDSGGHVTRCLRCMRVTLSVVHNYFLWLLIFSFFFLFFCTKNRCVCVSVCERVGVRVCVCMSVRVIRRVFSQTPWKKKLFLCLPCDWLLLWWCVTCLCLWSVFLSRFFLFLSFFPSLSYNLP